MPTSYDNLHQWLKKEQERLTKEMEELRAAAPSSRISSEGSPFGKREEEATYTSELEKRIALETHLKNQLSEITHALDKFEAGTYGLCDNCGQPIEQARLEARPQASLCLGCKARQEKNAKTKPYSR